jgi:hypothetical protein
MLQHVVDYLKRYVEEMKSLSESVQIKRKELKKSLEQYNQVVAREKRDEGILRIRQEYETEKFALKEQYLNTVIQEINEAKELIPTILRKPVPDEIRSLIDSYSQLDSLTDDEKTQVSNVVGYSSFLGLRLLKDKLGIDNHYLKMYGEILKNLDYLIELINRYLINGDVMITYNVGILTSHVTEDIVKETVDFYNRFK